MTTEAVYRQMMERIDGMGDRAVEVTRKLIAFKSVNPKFMLNPSASEEAALQAFIADAARELGYTVHVWDALPGRPNVVAVRTGTGGGKSLALNGHIDVVPEGDTAQWAYDPWEGQVVGNRLYGRGSVDMKGGVAAMLLLMEVLHELGIETQGELQFHFVVDEEGGGLGTQAVLAAGYRADAVIVTEPSGGQISVANGGLEWVRVTFTGQSAHAGWRYQQIYPQADLPASRGVNAIEKGWKFVGAVRELEREWSLRKRHPLLPPGITTISPGVFVGGAGLRPDGLPETVTNPAIIPDTAVIEFDLKYLPTESTEAVRAEFEAFVNAFAQTDPWLQEHPPRVDWGVHGVSFPPVNLELEHPLVALVRAGTGEISKEAQCVGGVGVCDVAFYAGAGIPGVVFGPSGSGAHGEDEYVEIDSILHAAKLYAYAVLHWCSVQE